MKTSFVNPHKYFLKDKSKFDSQNPTVGTAVFYWNKQAGKLWDRSSRSTQHQGSRYELKAG